MSSFDLLRQKAGQSVPFSSNDVRLSPGEWAVALVMLAAIFCCTPYLWQRAEPLTAKPDARIPYGLGNDYWMYSRCSRQACAEAKHLVLGDSVIWGHYVDSQHALSAQLNTLAGEPRFANVGVDGIHPAAMLGLVEYYGQAICGHSVLLHCNLLWMSSRRHDLQDKKHPSFQHPTLVPQFRPHIPCYNEPISARLGIAIGRSIPFFAWGSHLQVAFFGSTDLPKWTLDHPYENPLAAVTLKIPSSQESPSTPAEIQSWTEKQMPAFNAAWVDLDTSFQWRCFRQTIELLQQRGNRVFVLVGPFNEHMLTDKSRQVYRDRLGEVQSWLAEQKVAHRMATLLPSDDYADASHPLASGYAKLAQQLFEDDAFREFFRLPPTGPSPR
jgi:hypothetical protein